MKEHDRYGKSVECVKLDFILKSKLHHSESMKKVHKRWYIFFV